MPKWLKFLLILALIILFIVFVLPLIALFFTDLWWWQSEGYLSVYLKTLLIQLFSFLIPALLTWSLIHFWFYRVRKARKRLFFKILMAGSAVVSGVWGLVVWKVFILNLNTLSSQYRDPIFGLDATFYMFRLPLIEQTLWLLLFIFIFILIGDLVLHRIRKKRILKDGRVKFDGAVLLLVILISLSAIGLMMCKLFEVLVKQPDLRLGIGFSTVHGFFVGFYIFMGLLLLITFLFIFFSARKGTRLSRMVWVSLFMTALFFLLTRVLPSTVENYSVKPNELAVQKPFIRYRMDATVRAMNLSLEDYNFQHSVSRLPEIFGRTRIWDSDPYLKVIRQRQEIKSYFYFSDVDVDKYELSNQLRQVVLSVRELDTANLPADALTWDNLHLRYTHGDGVTLSPANTVDANGGPVFWISGLENKAAYPELKIDRPEIYFGEMSSNYVIVDTKTPEFDYTANTNRVTGYYRAKSGVSLNGFFKKLFFSMRFKEKKILLTRYLKPESRILFRRLIMQRVRILMPYLSYDKDPYPVILHGKLYWIIDAYTHSSRFPIAERFDTPFGKINYIRNSVKVVIDAYTGRTRYYVTDKADPILRAYRRVFPELFRDKIPPEIEEHFRYPVTLFNIQAAVLARYHVKDPVSFFNGDDDWKIPDQIYADKKVAFHPYYLLLRVKGGLRFSLINPFNPLGKENLAAWMLAFYDKGPHLALKYLDKTTSSLGPLQIESTIDQDDTLSRLFSLWNQQGSRIFRGNIQFIPLKEDVLYLESIFLESEQTSIPQLVRIVAVLNGHVYQGRRFDELLNSMAVGESGLGLNQSETSKMKAMAERAYRLYLQAEEERLDGKLKTYRETVDKIGGILKKISE